MRSPCFRAALGGNLIRELKKWIATPLQKPFGRRHAKHHAPTYQSWLMENVGHNLDDLVNNGPDSLGLALSLRYTTR